MPLFIAALIGALAQAAVSIVGRVLLALGFGMAVMTGVNSSLTWLKSLIQSQFSGLPGIVVDVLSTCQIGASVSVVLSALSARLLFDGMSSAGVIKRWGVK